MGDAEGDLRVLLDQQECCSLPVRFGVEADDVDEDDGSSDNFVSQREDAVDPDTE